MERGLQRTEMVSGKESFKGDLRRIRLHRTRGTLLDPAIGKYKRGLEPLVRKLAPGERVVRQPCCEDDVGSLLKHHTGTVIVEKVNPHRGEFAPVGRTRASPP